MMIELKKNRLFSRLKELEKENPVISLNIENYLYPVTNEILSRIAQHMPEYTMHDIKHCINILNIIADILPVNVELNIVELQILIYAVFLHDIGMVVNSDEVDNLKNSEDFTKITKEFDNQTSDDEILTELIRRTHVQRSLDYINIFQEGFAQYKIDFTFNSIDISQYIKNIIESHELPVEALENKGKYPIDTLIDGYTVNIQFLAILLRLGDILDFDITRAPHFLYNHINLKNEISISEWQKHQAIQGRTYKPEEIKFVAKPYSIQIHRKIEDFIRWIEIERKESIKLLDSNPNKELYYLQLIKEVEIDIQPQGYEYTNLEINLDYTNVLNILMGTELYDNVDIFLRELLQNSYDACKYYSEIYDKTKDDMSDNYNPKIIIKYNSEEMTLEIIDNGIGMDEDVFKNYVIAIGKSYYKSKYFDREDLNFQPISNFGIGILSCFMVSDTIEIESYKEGSIPIHYTMDISNKYISKYPTQTNRHGTRIKLRLHSDFYEKLEHKSLQEIINTNMSYHPIPITLKIDENSPLYFNNQSIEPPIEYKSIDGLITIEFDEDDDLEGYLVIHKRNGQQSYLKQNKLAQQHFTITTKNKQISLQPLWMQNLRYDINIPAERKLTLKASRNSIHEDENLLNIRQIISQKIIDYFMKNNTTYQNNFYMMVQYLGEGRGNALRFQNEYDFLTNLKMFQIHIPQKVDGNLTIISHFGSFREFYDLLTLSKTIKVAIVKEAYFTNKENLKILIPYLYQQGYEYIIIDNFWSINYFYQFTKPLSKINEIIVSDLPGFTYQNMIIEKEDSLDINSYDKQYSWTDINKNIHNKYFAVISNNSYNGFGIVLVNTNHKLGQLLESHNEKYYVKGFKNAIVNNFSKIYFSKQNSLSSFGWEIEENHYILEHNNLEAYASKFVNCLTGNFLDSLNRTLDEKVLTPLVNEGIITAEEKDSYYLSKIDFPIWYFKEEGEG